MKHTSLLLKLLLATFVVVSFTLAEAAPARKAGTSRGKTTTTKSTQSNGGAANNNAAANPNSCAQRGIPQQKCDQEGYSWDPSSCSCVDFGSKEWGFTPSSEYVCSNGKTMPKITAEACLGTIDQENCKCVADKGGSNGNNAGAYCEAALRKAAQSCQADLQSANTTCDNDQDSGIQSAKSQLSEFAVGLGNQVALNKPCAGIAKYVGGLNAAVAGFAAYCSTARDSCMTSCRKALAELESKGSECVEIAPHNLTSLLRSTKEHFDECKQLITKVDLAKGAVQNLVQTVKGAQACVDQTTTAASDYCKANPTALGCAQEPAECANPTFAAQNPICFCTGPAALSNPKCRAASRATSSEFGTSGMQLPNSKTGGEPDPTFGSEKEEWKGLADYKPGSNQGEDPGGKKGGRPVEGGSGGSGGGAPGADGGAGGEAAGGPQINNGFRAGSGSGGGGFGGGGGGSDGRYANGAQENGSGGAGGPDLRQFLPGGKYAPGQRGIAGLTGPDGITGPHDNIWRKVKNRYKAETDVSKFLGH